jgi:hypothetical protein
MDLLKGIGMFFLILLIPFLIFAMPGVFVGLWIIIWIIKLATE